MCFFKHQISVGKVRWGKKEMKLVRGHLQEDITAIYQQVIDQVNHDVLTRYVENPPISFLRMKLLYLFLTQLGLAQSMIHRYIVTSSLVQLGLDSHENIGQGKEETLQAIRTRQLTVLAGDFFSSKYYYLLARAGDVRGIRQLAKGIEKINEFKMKLYREKNINAEDYLQRKTEIEAQLLLSFVEDMACDKKEIWHSFIYQLILIEYLLHDYEACRWNHNPGQYYNLLSRENGAFNSYRILVNRIHQAVFKGRKLLNGLSDTTVYEDLKQILDDYVEKLDNQNGLAEEL
jgi:heptaprenyl diphosphate synthase